MGSPKRIGDSLTRLIHHLADAKNRVLGLQPPEFGTCWGPTGRRTLINFRQGSSIGDGVLFRKIQTLSEKVQSMDWFKGKFEQENP